MARTINIPRGRLYDIKQHASFECTGKLVVGDPPGITSQGEKGAARYRPCKSIKAEPGNWLIFTRHPKPRFASCSGPEVAHLIACHEDVAKRAVEIDETAIKVGRFIVEGGQACIVDAQRRDDPTLLKELEYGAEEEIIGDCAFIVSTGGDGPCTVWADDKKKARLVCVRIMEDREVLDGQDEGSLPEWPSFRDQDESIWRIAPAQTASVESLNEALDDGGFREVAAIARKLCEDGEESSTASLVSALGKLPFESYLDGSHEAAHAIMVALVNFGAADAAGAVLKVLKQCRAHEFIPETACFTLAKLRDQSTVGPLLDLVDSSDWQGLAPWLCAAVCEIAPERAAPEMLKRMKSAEKGMQPILATAVGHLRYQPGAVEIRKRLRARASRAYAMAALLKMNDETTIAGLVDSCQAGIEWPDFMLAINVIRDSRQAEVAQTLLAKGNEAGWRGGWARVRIEVLGTANLLGVPEARAGLQEVADDPKSKQAARWRSAIALLEGGEEGYLQFLLDAIQPNKSEPTEEQVPNYQAREVVISALHRCAKRDPAVRLPILDSLHAMRLNPDKNPSLAYAAQNVIKDLTGFERYSDFAAWRPKQSSP